MIERHWKGIARREQAEQYVRHLRTKTFPHLTRLAGYIRSTILRRAIPEGVEFLVVTVWEDLDSIRQFAGEDINVANVPEEAREMMVEFDTHVTHYEVVPGVSTSSDLTGSDEDILAGCLRAAVFSNFFPEWEFGSIFGVSREVVKDVYLRWPHVDFSDSDVVVAVHNTVNNLAGYPLGDEDLEYWADYIKVSRDELCQRFPQFQGIM